MKKITNSQKAYIAGFLDGDGSVYVKLTKNDSYKYGYQIAPYITFYQKENYINFLEELKSILGVGYTRLRKDGVAEYIIGDEKSLIIFAKEILPFSKLKSKQLKLLLKILKLKVKIKNAKNFIDLCKKIDTFRELNYSKKRIQDSLEVKKNLIKKNLLTP
ncbi:MAG TPA: LAGLIDADG family homing endonuclease [Candidatus Pacearchaeota archaeon]|nr:LAGLIDADG family homing endonuclease [Candidatus Pacearchaeota archaeon]